MKTEELFSVRGLSIVVTGGASGIGLAFAEILSENGARVAILDIDERAMAREVERLSAAGGDVRGLRVDILDRASIYSAIKEIGDFYGKLDVVFVNAGFDTGSGFLDLTGRRVLDGQIENVPDDEWDRVVAGNLTAVVATAKAVVPYLRKAGGGRIIVTTSIAATTVNAISSLGYYPSKAGAAHLARRLALELAGSNILVNSIAPGGIATNIAGGLLKDPEVQATLARSIPLHRVGQPDDLKGLAIFLASAASAYITGAHFVIDGGTILGSAD
ncbi:MAG: novJ [Sphingomonas bacterium]|uniref:SDR family NAD(P)-dependent oxidoreductase n=1 Tax=Sphingomonas bacterium TaxID=1895847 RepID=UPI002623D4EC|nr:SDR family oxidoreductase [Sphingomonas bacterium]MDB5710730.1 novJ [Sphingomonas bacterium]